MRKLIQKPYVSLSNYLKRKGLALFFSILSGLAGALFLTRIHSIENLTYLPVQLFPMLLILIFAILPPSIIFDYFKLPITIKATYCLIAQIILLNITALSGWYIGEIVAKGISQEFMLDLMYYRMSYESIQDYIILYIPLLTFWITDTFIANKEKQRLG